MVRAVLQRCAVIGKLEIAAIKLKTKRASKNKRNFKAKGRLLLINKKPESLCAVLTL